MKHLCGVLASFVVGSAAAWAGFDEDYPPKTIAQALEEMSPTTSEIAKFRGGGNWFDMGSGTAFLAKVSCKTAAAPLTSREKQFLAAFFQAQGRPERAAQFSHAIECVEGAESYRLPAQEVLLQTFRRDVRDSVFLYLMYAGSVINEAGKATPVVLVNEYRVQ